MNKEEILKRNREENKNFDEREKQELGKSFGFGGFIVALLCMAFSIVDVINGKKFYQFGVILFGYLAATAWYSLKILRKKSYLIQAILYTITVILGFILYIVEG